MDVHAAFGDSGLNSDHIIGLCPSRPVLSITFMQYLIAFYSRLEETSDVISGANVGHVGVDAPVKFGNYKSNCSRDIRLPHFVTNDHDGDASICRSFHNKPKISRFQ